MVAISVDLHNVYSPHMRMNRIRQTQRRDVDLVVANLFLHPALYHCIRRETCGVHGFPGKERFSDGFFRVTP
jgi:hypothetical protein